MPRNSSGSFAPPRDWDALRRAYEAHDGDLAELAARNNIELATLKTYANRKKWNRDTPVPLASHPPPKSPKRPAALCGMPAKPPPPAKRRTKPVLDQLTDVLIRKLQKLEFDMENQTDLSPSDHERHTRALGSITNSLEKVSDLKRADAAGTIDKPSATGTTTADDAERLRRELAARIRRLREQLAR